MNGGSDEGQVFRTFWHGRPLSQYHLLCLQSFVARGHRVEIFSYDDQLALPNWVVRKDAQQILPSDHILRYQKGPGQGSPALHANLFRYTMLHRLGGWWIDMDVVLIGSQLPTTPVFFGAEHIDAAAGDSVFGTRFGNAVIKMPPQHPLLVEAIERCLTIGEAARWSQTGPVLFTELANKYDLARYGSPIHAVYPISWREFPMFFNPARSTEVKNRCGNAIFVHLWNEMWRRSGVPDALGPPPGSFLDWLASGLGIDFKLTNACSSLPGLPPLAIKLQNVE